MQSDHIIPETFWANVLRVDDESCWQWMASTDNRGRGLAAGYLAHRIAYELTHGAIPKGKLVLHKCSTPHCVNPDHLYVGTQADNARDTLERNPDHYFGTFGGYKRYCAKLTENQVRDIRVRAYMLMDTNIALAREYDVDPNTITAILARNTWKHVACEVPPITRRTTCNSHEIREG